MGSGLSARQSDASSAGLGAQACQERRRAMSDDKLFGSPLGAQGRVRPKLDVRNFGKPEEHNGDRRCCSYFALVCMNWLFSLRRRRGVVGRGSGEHDTAAAGSGSATRCRQRTLHGDVNVAQRPDVGGRQGRTLSAGICGVAQEFGLTQTAALTELRSLLNVWGNTETFRANIFKSENEQPIVH